MNVLVKPTYGSAPADPSGPTIRQALDVITSWNDLPPRRQRTMAAALNKVLELSDKEERADTVHLDPLASLAMLERASPALSRISNGTLANYRTALRSILRRLGLLEFARQQPKAVSNPAWAVLLAQLPAKVRDFARLRAFASYCELEGIPPHLVGQATIDAYAARRTAERGGTRQRDQARRVAALWNRAGREVADWPPTRLGPTPNGRQISQPLAAYSTTLQAEIEAYLRNLSRTGDNGRRKLFSGGGAVRPPRKPRTVKTRKESLRRLLHGAVQGGIPLTEITSLRVVTTLPFIETALNWHFERKGERLTADMGVFAATIASISQYLGITGPAWDVIKGRLDEVKPPARTGMTERNTLLNEQLKDAQTRAALLHLPAMLMGEAARLKDGWQDLRGPHHPPRPQEAGWLSQVAVAIEILLNAPVRMANLHTMRLGQELRLTQVTRSRWRGLILVDETQSKNNRGVEFPLAPETVALLRRHLDEFRPLLPNVETDWLFSGAATPDRPRHPSSLGDAITNTIYQYVGLRMNPHAFRAFAGARILARNPHAIDDVRAVLGHSGFQTAMIYYTAVNGRAAAERLSADLARERRDTAHLVPPLPTRRGRPQRGKPERGK